MIKNKDLRKYAEGLNLSPVIPALIFAVMGLAFIALPQVFATSLNVTQEISAPADQVWRIIANVDYEPQYWSTFKEINNIKRPITSPKGR